MAAAHYFFSTLAQASAAVIGFVVAVSAALYSIERRRVEKRTEDYRDALMELRNQYAFGLESLANMLDGETGGIDQEAVEMPRTNDELEDYVISDQKPVSKLLLIHLRRILILFKRIEPQNEHLLSEDELKSLQRSVYWFYEHFNQLDDTSRKFIEEVSGRPYDEIERAATAKIFGDISSDVQSFSAFQIERWFSTFSQSRDEVERSEHEESGASNSHYLTGDNFWSLMAISQRLSNEVRKASRKASGTIIQYDPGIRLVIRLTTYLLIVGVVIPTSFLLTGPIVLPWWFILLSQILLLLTTVLLSGILIEVILRSAEPSNQMGDTDTMSRYSSWVVQYLPQFPF